jgi:AcrR family transcriptional regulator
MPKLVDHDERRRDIAHAVLRIVARGGVRAADIRSVASEAGWSAGVITHYFSDKQALLAGALREAAEDVAGRMKAIFARRSGVARLKAMLEAGMPLDEERAATCRIFYHFASEGLSDPAFMTEIAGYYAAWRGAVADAVRALMDDGELAGGDPEMLAAALVGLTEGLAVQGLVDERGMPPRQLKAILGAGVDCMLSCGAAR